MHTHWHMKFIVIMVVILTGCSAPGSGGGFPDSGSSGGSGSGGNTTGSNSPGLPPASYRQQPGEITFNGCPPQGDGGDPVLNENKNRVDNGHYQPTSFNTVLNLPW